jgi:Amt family ammonium transporter
MPYLAVNTGDTAWMLASSALVLLMTPGLAFFYGGMVRTKSVLNMLMMNFACIGLVSLMWVLYGFSEAFGNDSFHGLIGNFTQYVGMSNTKTYGLFETITTPAAKGVTASAIPILVFAAFQLMFAIITPALASGCIADRTKFGPWCIWVVLWTSIVYFPVAHWVFDFSGTTTLADGIKPISNIGGWIANNLHGEDFAGGTAVHINAGAAGLALALVLGKRVGWKKDPMRPHNVPYVMLGAALLWFGWFGFNAGSAVSSGQLAGFAFINTNTATATAMLGWMAVERLRDGHATALGAASGAVAGLVAITPACGYINPGASIVLGFVAGAICAFAVGIKWKLGFDDSLDVVGVHLVGGITGTVLIGLFGDSTSANPGDQFGLFYGGGFKLLGRQVVAAAAVMVFSFTLSYIIAMIIDKTMGMRVSVEDEESGIDLAEHGETAYDTGPGLGGGHRPSPQPVGAHAAVAAEGI